MDLNNFGYYWLDTWVMANIIQCGTCQPFRAC